MADETEFSTDDIRDSLNVETSPEDGEDSNGTDQEDELDQEDGEENLDSGEDNNDGEDGSEEDGEDEVDPDAEASSGGEDEDDGEKGEEVELTPEHQVGAGIHKFMEERIPADRVEEGMGNFQKSLNIVADQMNGDYESYWKGITPSLQQAATDNPEIFLDTLAPMYQEVLESAGRMLTKENRVLVDNMEISEEVALKMQQQDHKLKMSQKNIDMFKTREGEGKEQQDRETYENDMTLSFRETCEAMEKTYPNLAKLRDEIMKPLTDRQVGSPEELQLLVENTYHTYARSNPVDKPKSGQGKKNPIRSNRSSSASKPANNPDAEFSNDEISKSLKAQSA